MKRLLTTATLAALILGTPAAAADAVWPTGEQRARLAAHIRSVLRDPQSVREPLVSTAFLLEPGDPAPAVCAHFDAKNAYGAYSGRRATGYIVFSNGQVMESSSALARCKDQLYQPFSELAGG